MVERQDAMNAKFGKKREKKRTKFLAASLASPAAWRSLSAFWQEC
jgi:hypothetical protein